MRYTIDDKNKAFVWIPFFMEMANKLLRYRNERTPLVNWIYNNLQGYVNHLKDNPDGRPLPDIDPFTVYGIINRAITYEKKIDICTKLKGFLGISAPVPQVFYGVPEMNNQLSAFIGYGHNRKDGDIDRLWNLFEDTVLGRDIEKSYDTLNGQFLIKYIITMGLFWIRPDRFLALDGNNRKKLTQLGIATFKHGFVPYKDYEAIMERLDEKIASGEINCSNYAEFSHEAYIMNDGSEKVTASVKSSSKNEKAYWTFSPGEHASKWDFCLNEGVMCMGWDKLGDYSKYSSLEETNQAIKRFYTTEGSAKNDTLAVWQFANELKPGDIVFAKRGRNTIIGRGVVESEYMFDDHLSNYKHIRKVKWTDVGEWKTEEMHAMKTLTNITKYSDYVKRLNNKIDGISDIVSESFVLPETNEVDYWWLYANPKVWEIDSFNVGDIQEYTAYNEKGNKRQIFKYFKAVKPGDKLICYETTPTKRVKALCEITQGLHEDDGYEVFNFVIRDKVDYQIPWHELVLNEVFQGSEPYRAATGSLYHLTKKEYDAITELVNRKPEKYTIDNFLKDVFMTKSSYIQLESLLLRKKNLILQGAPGVGKTYAAKRLAYAIMGEKNEDKVRQVQFHQNYSYEDFVMGYKPNSDGGFDLKHGKFYKLCKEAEKDRNHKFFFIIDEINRGNLSKIFGELLMLIESEYRDKPIELSYNDEEFSVPSNVYILGMMNTADRSLAMIDYALRRRFSFFEMKPGFENPQFIQYYEEKKDARLDKLVKAIIKLNKTIASDDSLGSGFCIGHSYLCDLGDEYDLESIVEYDIIPMLREYWFDNDERFNCEAQELRNAIK